MEARHNATMRARGLLYAGWLKLVGVKASAARGMHGMGWQRMLSGLTCAVDLCGRPAPRWDWRARRDAEDEKRRI